MKGEDAMSRIDLTRYEIAREGAERRVRIVVLSDLHSCEGREIGGIVDEVRRLSPDLVLMPGDTFERLDGSAVAGNERGLELVRSISGICPTFLSVGNHENGGDGSWNLIKWYFVSSVPFVYDGGDLERIRASGGVLLDNEYAEWQGIRIGGLSSGLINPKRRPHLDWLKDFCAFDGFKILMCHHPEYYKKYLRDMDIDLIVSGHAHGGQWRFFGRGVFAPGQGIFPKYTSGVHHGRLVVSRGLKPSGRIPRIFNNPEIVCVDV